MTRKTHVTEALRFRNHDTWEKRFPKQFEEFLEATSEHMVTVHRADGLYNHLSFANPKTSDHSFEVVTSPGQLTVLGDLGTAIFAREPDMLRMMDTEHRYDIDPHSWMARLEAFDKYSSVKKFSSSKFQKSLIEDFWMHSRDETAQATAQAWRVINNYVQAAASANHIEEVEEILSNITDELEYEDSFADFREFDNWDESFYEEWQEFSETYIWILYAAHFAAQNYIALSATNKL